MRWRGESQIKITLKTLRIRDYINRTCPLCKYLHLYDLFIFLILGTDWGGTISDLFSNKRKLGNLRGNYPTSALQQSSRAFRKILSVDQGNVHCFAGRLKDCRNRPNSDVCDRPDNG